MASALWTWIAGSNIPDQSGIYGSHGIPASGNVPSARAGAASWIDGNDHFWVFGGFGRAAAGSLGDLNDLWRFEGLHWTWIAGHDGTNQSGVCGEFRQPAAGNVPGARTGASGWVDGAGHF